MAAYGMNIEQANRLARDVRRNSDDISALVQTLMQRFADLDWFGPDADRFRSDQVPPLTEQLKAVQRGSRVLADDAERHAAEQRKVSES